MSRVSLATVLLISVLLGGCFGAPIAEWGSGTGEFETKWDNNPETLFNVTSKISESTAQMDLNLQGCDDDGALAQQERAHRPLNAGRCGFLCEPQSDVPQRGGHCCDVVMPSSHPSLAKGASEAGQARQLWRANAAGSRPTWVRTGGQSIAADL